MILLSIDPASYNNPNSNTGAVLLDGIDLVKGFVLQYGQKGLEELSEALKDVRVDKVICEKYEVRTGDYSADNSVLETIEAIKQKWPDVELVRNAGYKSDAPNHLLRALELYSFGKSHHQDATAAARLAIFWYMRNDYQEEIQQIGKKVEAWLEK